MGFDFEKKQKRIEKNITRTFKGVLIGVILLVVFLMSVVGAEVIKNISEKKELMKKLEEVESLKKEIHYD